MLYENRRKVEEAQRREALDQQWREEERCKELEEMQRHAKEESGGARTSKPNNVVG